MTDTYLNKRLGTIKLLEENKGKNFLDIGLGNNFLNDTKSLNTKAKISKCDHIKLKSFSIANETIIKMKRQSIEWESILANHYLTRG